MTSYVKIKFCYINQRIFINQQSYSKDFMLEFDILNCNTCKTPTDTNIKLINNIESDSINVTTYYHIINKFFYLINYRLDISYIVGVFSRFITNLLQIYLEMAKKILIYLASMLRFKILLKYFQHCEIKRFIDLD